jgi:hypothetical protein
MTMEIFSGEDVFSHFGFSFLEIFVGGNGVVWCAEVR